MTIPTLIYANQATLTIIHRDHEGEEKFAGFVVHQSVFLGIPPKHLIKVIAPYVELWVSEVGADGVAAIDAYVTAWANDLKCVGIVESSPRPGWTRRLEKLGYKLAESTMLKWL